MKKIRVLNIMNGAGTGGISRVVLGICQSLINEGYSFDIAIDNPEIGYSGEKLIELGCNIKIIPRRRNIIEYCKTIKQLVKKNNYDYIHIHLNESSTLPLILAKLFGCKRVFVHMHTARTPKGIKDKFNFLLLRVVSRYLADKLIACSTEAGKTMFGEALCKKRSFVLCKNYINAEIYSYNLASRNRVRNELECNNNTLVIGCVGTLREEKNNIFSVEVFENILKYKNDAKLVFVGDGNRRNVLMEYIKDHGLSDKVILKGNTNNVPDYLSSFDCLLMPSLYEGFGLAALEATASGLPVVLSDAITQDLSVFENIKYLSLRTEPKVWANTIISLTEKQYDRSHAVEIVKEQAFDFSSAKGDYKALYSN